jgi:hypothetical protein
MQILHVFRFAVNKFIAIPKRNNPSAHLVRRVCLMSDVSLTGFAALAWFVFWVCVDSAIAAGYV